MTESRPESLVGSIFRPWFVLLGLVAGVVQLATAPWSLTVRVSILGSLALVALVIVAYEVGLRYGRFLVSQPQPASSPTTGGSKYLPDWSAQFLLGVTFVKVAAHAGNVSICELREDFSLVERWLPLSAPQALSDGEARRGAWVFGREGLRIIVNGYNLLIEPGMNGIWTGTEQGGEESTPFIGAVLDPRPPQSKETWSGIKLGEHGARRIFKATFDGQLMETDPFKPSHKSKGCWSVGSGLLQIDVEGDWHLTARDWWRPGVLLGSEQSGRGTFDFAVVRASLGHHAP